MPHPYIYTGFNTSRDKGSLMKLLPLDLRFPKSKLNMAIFLPSTKAIIRGVKLPAMLC